MSTCSCQDKLSAPVNPPAEWFTKPADLKPGERRLTPEGRVAGYVARWGECLLNGSDQCFTPPQSPTGYRNAMQGSTRTAEGTVIRTANIGGRVNHKNIWAAADEALDHYANTATRSMRVVYGEDEYGIWYAGALESDLTPSEVEHIAASAVSGDWRWRQKLRDYDLAGVQLVNVPGYPDADFEPTYVALAAGLGEDTGGAPGGITRVVSVPWEIAQHMVDFAAELDIDLEPITAAPEVVRTQTGVMVAVPISDEVAGAAGITEDPPHCTLAYLGKVTEVDLVRLRQAMADFRFEPLTGVAGGIGAFPDMGDGMPVWMPLDIEGLNQLAARVRDHLRWWGLPVRTEHAFVPHVTLRYQAEGKPLPEPIEIMPISVSSLLVCHGELRWEVPAGNPVDSPVDEHMAMAAAAGLTVGSFVKWGSFGRATRGKIVGIKQDGSYTVAGSSVIVNAKPGNPAVLIEIYNRENRNSNKFVPSGKRTAKLMSTIVRWAGPNSANPTSEKAGTDRETREAKTGKSASLGDIIERIGRL